MIWILAGGDDLSFLAFWNPRIRRFSDDGLTLCGAYGYRIGSQPRIEAEAAGRLRHWTKTEEAPRIDQLRLAYETLQEMPTSRQVVIQIWDRTLDLPNPRIRSKDVPCNLVSHLMIRHGKLEWLQIMRSNDLFWGFPYNVIQFTTLQEIVAGWLGVGLGTYMHISDSLHAYQRHWNDLDTTSNRVHTKNPLNNASLAIKGYGPWEETFSRVVSCAFKLTVSSSASDLVSIFESVSDILPAYREWLALLTAEALRRRGFGQDALKIAKAAGPYWGSSWRKWAHRAEAQRRVRTDSRFELAGAAPQVRE